MGLDEQNIDQRMIIISSPISLIISKSSISRNRVTKKKKGTESTDEETDERYCFMLSLYKIKMQ